MVLMLLLGSWAVNSSLFAPSHKRSLQILAHRGLHQTFSPIGLTSTTCTASRIDKPVHNYLENTLSSMKEAINLGADIIEFDIHPTTDGEFVVFHDWNLECRTNGIGVTREQNSKYLKTLDIGYGYTADGGKTYPFRGKFIGEMPILSELFREFPNIGLMINIKSNNTDEATKLTQYLKKHKKIANRKRLSVFGSGVGIERFANLNTDIKTLSKQKSKECIKSYVLTGWTGHISKACHNSYVPVPENYQWIIWGWPNRFEARLRKIGSRSVLLGQHKEGQANTGIDSIESIKNIPKEFGGVIFTNRIDLIGKNIHK